MGVIIGMDPHKRSATIEVIDEQARVLAAGRYGTDKAGDAEMIAAGRKFAERVWAIEGAMVSAAHRAPAGRQRRDGPVMCPPSCRRRCGSSRPGTAAIPTRWTRDSVALAALRSPGLVTVEVDPDLVVLGLLADRRDELGQARTQAINRIHRLLLELLPGGAKKFLSAAQARALIAAVRPRDIAGKTRRRLASELITELKGIDRKIKACKKDITALVKPGAPHCCSCTASGPPARPGCSPSAGNFRRFASRDHFASWKRHRAAGCRLWPAAAAPAVTRLQPADQLGAAHHGRRPAAQPDRRPRLLRLQDRGRQDPDEAMRCLKRRPVQRRLPADAPRPAQQPVDENEPGRALGDDTSIRRDRPDPGHRLFG